MGRFVSGADRSQTTLFPECLDDWVDADNPDSHTLMVLGVTPAQWEKIDRREITLPDGWSLENSVPFCRKKA